MANWKDQLETPLAVCQPLGEGAPFFLTICHSTRTSGATEKVTDATADVVEPTRARA